MKTIHRLAIALSITIPLAPGCTTSAAPGSGADARPASAGVGQRVPGFVISELGSGAPVALRSLEGKVVLLDIWASWCGPCQEELPLLDDMAARLESKGVEVIAVSVDEEKAKAEAFLKRREKWTLRVGHDPEGKIPRVLEPPKMPTSYVIDRHGVLREINSGFERADAARIEAELTELAGAR